MYVLLAIVGIVATASAKDLTVGREGGSLIYEQNVTASPTIWRQEKQVTFNVSESEIITQVVIVDRRADKSGEAAIIEGGEGHKNVTIELKSPAVFRGFDFEVQVYAKQENDAETPVDNDQQTVQDPLLQDTNVNEKQRPKTNTDDVVIGSPVSTTSTTPVPNSQNKIQHPVMIGQEDNLQERPNRDIQGDNKSEDEINSKNKPDVQATKPTAEPAKPVADPTKATQDFQSIDIQGDNGDKQVSSSTTKSVEDQKTVKPVEIQKTDGTQQVTKQVNVPLPYVKH